MTHEQIFSDIYRRKLWGDGSGGGGRPEVAKPWAELVSRIIREENVKTVLDIGCGDGWAASHIDLNGAQYIGMDVALEMVEFCRANHPWGLFAWGNAVAALSAPADLVLLKEVTQHLGDSDADTLLARLYYYPLVLHSSCITGPADAPMITGGYRPVILSESPWSLKTERLLEWTVGDSSYIAELWRPRG